MGRLTQVISRGRHSVAQQLLPLKDVKNLELQREAILRRLRDLPDDDDLDPQDAPVVKVHVNACRRFLQHVPFRDRPEPARALQIRSNDSGYVFWRARTLPVPAERNHGNRRNSRRALRNNDIEFRPGRTGRQQNAKQHAKTCN